MSHDTTRAADLATVAESIGTLSPPPKRIQRKRTKGWRMPAGAVSVTRPGVFGNPFTPEKARCAGYCGDLNNLSVVAFRDWLLGLGGLWWQGPECDRRRKAVWDRLPELRGKDLACWCPLDRPCHADVLLELANREVCQCTACGTPVERADGTLPRVEKKAGVNHGR